MRPIPFNNTDLNDNELNSRTVDVIGDLDLLREDIFGTGATISYAIKLLSETPSGTVTFSSISSLTRTDYQSVAFAADLPNANYSVVLEVSDPASMGEAIAYDKAVNGFKIRITGSGGGVVTWKVIYN